MTKKQKLQIKSRVTGIIVVIIGCLTYPLGLVAVPVLLSAYAGASIGKELDEAAHFEMFVLQNKVMVTVCAVLMLCLVAALLLIASFTKTQLKTIHYFYPLIAFLPVVIFSEIAMFKKNGLKS